MQQLPIETLNTVFKCLEGYTVITTKDGFVNGQGERILLIESKRSSEPILFDECKKHEDYRWILVHNHEITYLAPGAYQMINDLLTDHQNGRVETLPISCKSNMGKKRRQQRNNNIEVAISGTLNKETGEVDVNIFN